MGRQQKGKFIVLYGSNNIGKSEQANRLVEILNSLGIDTDYLKYPIYELEPTGSELNRILRENNPKNYSAEDAQRFFARNRLDYQPTLEKALAMGRWEVAEDYTGTGIAWGLTFVVYRWRNFLSITGIYYGRI